jgi:hypothetical protein
MATISPGQQAFLDEITSQVNNLLGAQLPGKFTSISYPPGFNYAIQYSQPPIYNSIALDTLNSTLELGTNGVLTLADQRFSTLYFKILTAAAYRYSDNDNKIVQDPNIQAQQTAVANEATSSGYVDQFPDDFQGSPTYYATIKSVLKEFIKDGTPITTVNITTAAQGLLNAGFASLAQAISNSVNQLAPLNAILNQQSQRTSEIQAAMTNAQFPSAANGGLQITHGKNLELIDDPVVVGVAQSCGYVAQFPKDFSDSLTYLTVLNSVLKEFGDPSSKSLQLETQENIFSHLEDILKAIMNLATAGFVGLTQAIADSLSQTKKTVEAQYYVGWDKLPTTNQVLGGLQSGGTLTINISASNFHSQQTTFSIGGQAGFSLPVGDFFSININGGASYDLSKYTSDSSLLDMNLSYTGVSMVQAGEQKPLTADYYQGWYDLSLLRSIVTGSDNRQVSGFKIDPHNQYNVKDTFGEGKPFSHILTFVISNFPVIKMTFAAAQVSKIKTDFKQDASIKVKLLGLFTIGSIDQTYQVESVDESSVSGKIIVTLSPPVITGTVPLNQQVCNILGGVADYPPKI